MTIIKKQIILIIAFCVLFTFFFFSFFIFPAIKIIKNDSLRLIELKKSLVVLDNQASNIESMKISCQVASEDLEKSANIFINQEVPVGLIRFVEDEADRVNLDISISPVSLKKIDDDIWPFVSFRLNLLGSYINFMRFFERIETYPFLIEIQDLVINKVTVRELAQEGYGKNDVIVTLTIRAFGK